MSDEIPRGERVQVDAETVSALIADQFPHWAELPVRPVELSGWDNHTFRLGPEMKVRLPASAVYLPQAAKENTWLPRLAPQLPYPVPVPLGVGRPGHGYPFPWSVWGWLDGRPATPDQLDDLSRFATEVAGFLRALQRCSTDGGPLAGAHSFYRGGDLSVYDGETRDFLARASHLVDVATIERLWRTALASRWERDPVWVHGDIAYGNLLVDDGRLSAVIDFGTSAVGDPACDLVISWTLFDARSRARFRELLDLDEQTWDRARGWCVWKSLLVLAGNLGDHEAEQRELAIIEAACRD